MKKVICLLILFTTIYNVSAQDKKIIRIARISIDASQANEYRKLLKEQMEAAIKLEPGVLSYTVYADKTDPCRITILEVYADSNAYLAHREAPHFKKYKAATKDMVQSLELSEVDPVLALKKETE